MTQIQKLLEKIAPGELPRIRPEYLLTKWQTALIELLNWGRDSVAYRPSEEEEGRIIRLAQQKEILQLISIDKAEIWGLSALAEEIKKAGYGKKSLSNDINQLLNVLSGEELTDATFAQPQLGKSIEQFFSLH